MNTQEKISTITSFFADLSKFNELKMNSVRMI